MSDDIEKKMDEVAERLTLPIGVTVYDLQKALAEAPDVKPYGGISRKSYREMAEMTKANRFRFRVWVKHLSKMGDFTGCELLNKGVIYLLIDGDEQRFPPSDLIIMQSTGLCDSKGVEIFEGDIIEYDGYRITVSAPEWHIIDAFMVWGYKGLDSFRDDYKLTNEPSRVVREGHVVGNIYELPPKAEK